MNTTHFATCSRPDGYNGHHVIVALVWDATTLAVLEVHPLGFHRSPALASLYIDAGEAAWHLAHHPTARRFYQVAA